MCALLTATMLVLTSGQDQQAGPELTMEQRYNIVTVADMAILLDRLTGRTWILRSPQTRGNDPIWVPMQRLGDDEQEVRQALEQDLLVQLAQLRRQYGPNHPAVLTVEMKLQKLRSGADGERDR